jgi:hypothetical protein
MLKVTCIQLLPYFQPYIPPALWDTSTLATRIAARIQRFLPIL